MGIRLEYGAYVTINHIMPKETGLKLCLHLKNEIIAIVRINIDTKNIGLNSWILTVLKAKGWTKPLAIGRYKILR
jgi:hypothetical protein